MKKLTSALLIVVMITAVTAHAGVGFGVGIGGGGGGLSFGVGGPGYYGGYGYGYPGYYGGYYGYPYGGYPYGGYPYYGPGYGPYGGVNVTIPVGGYSQPKMWIFENGTDERVIVSSSTGSVSIDPGGSRSMRRPRSRRRRGCRFSIRTQKRRVTHAYGPPGGPATERKTTTTPGQIADFNSCNEHIRIIKRGTQLDIQ